MFFRVIQTRTVHVFPKDFGPRLREALVHKLTDEARKNGCAVRSFTPPCSRQPSPAQVEGRIQECCGQVVAVTEILKVSPVGGSPGGLCATFDGIHTLCHFNSSHESVQDCSKVNYYRQ
jgi:hypothetical protein